MIGKVTTFFHTWPLIHRIMSASNASLSLFRSLLREARRVDNYNFRLYAIRRVKIGFRNNRDLTGWVTTALWQIWMIEVMLTCFSPLSYHAIVLLRLCSATVHITNMIFFCTEKMPKLHSERGWSNLKYWGAKWLWGISIRVLGAWWRQHDVDCGGNNCSIMLPFMNNLGHQDYFSNIWW